MIFIFATVVDVVAAAAAAAEPPLMVRPDDRNRSIAAGTAAVNLAPRVICNKRSGYMLASWMEKDRLLAFYGEFHQRLNRNRPMTMRGL